MADFCNQCAKELFNHDTGDFPKRSTPPEGEGYLAVCEGCGITLVDGDGNCMGPEGCLMKHPSKLKE